MIFGVQQKKEFAPKIVERIQVCIIDLRNSHFTRQTDKDVPVNGGHAPLPHPEPVEELPVGRRGEVVLVGVIWRPKEMTELG